MAGTAQTHKTPRRGTISKSGGLFAQGSNPVGRRQAQFLAEIRERALSKIRKTDQCLVRYLAHLANGFQVGCSESVLDPGGKQYPFNRRIVRQFWSGSEHRTLGRLSNQAFFAEALPIFMECCLGFFLVGDRLLRLPHSESFSLSSRQARIGAFLVGGHFPFVFGIHSKPARKRQVAQQPTPDGLIWVCAVVREFVFVFYLHRERFGLLVRLSLFLRK